MSKMDKIMLRFRPIAPKPSTISDDNSDGSTRKHAQDITSYKRCNRRRKNLHPPAVTTLPLLPETPDPKDDIEEESIPPEANNNKYEPVWMSFENHDDQSSAVSEKMDPATVGLGGSVVTVECVMDTWQGDEAGEWLLGKSRDDEERKMKLENDTCPGFISDGYGRVTWRNNAYREMVGEGEIWLGRVPYPYSEKGFTCRVKVQYACGKERMVPCDAWRMDCGGFAWRLDVNSALTLSNFPF